MFMSVFAVPVMLDECLEYLTTRQKKEASFTFEVLVVDDGSKDETCAVVAQYMDRYGADAVRCLKLARNRGKGGAVRMVRLCYVFDVASVLDIRSVFYCSNFYCSFFNG